MSRPLPVFSMGLVLLIGGAVAGFTTGWSRPNWAPSWVRDRLDRWSGESTVPDRQADPPGERAGPTSVAIDPNPPAARDRATLPTVRLASEEVARMVGIETAPAGAVRHAHSLSANAEAAYDSRRYATVSPRVAGFLREVRADLGRRVHRGDNLAVVDSAEISAARTQFLSARAALNLAEATHVRTASLAKTGQVAARTELESRTALEQAKAAVMDAEQRLRNLGMGDAEIDRIRTSDDRASLLEVVAPIDGTIVSLRAVQGEAVQATAPLFTIADTRTMWLWIDVYESEIGQVRKGQSVDFLVPGSETPVASGRVTWMGTEVNPTTRTTRVRAELANPEGKVRANQFGKARLRIGEVHSAVVVPSGTVQRWEKDQYVFLPRPGLAFEPRRVQTRPIDGDDRVEIVEGLQPGELIVVAGAYRLKSEIDRGAIAEE